MSPGILLTFRGADSRIQRRRTSGLSVVDGQHLLPAHLRRRYTVTFRTHGSEMGLALTS